VIVEEIYTPHASKILTCIMHTLLVEILFKISSTSELEAFYLSYEHLMSKFGNGNNVVT
jgi:hypothetical protein